MGGLSVSVTSAGSRVHPGFVEPGFCGLLAR